MTEQTAPAVTPLDAKDFQFIHLKDGWHYRKVETEPVQDQVLMQCTNQACQDLIVLARISALEIVQEAPLLQEVPSPQSPPQEQASDLSQSQPHKERRSKKSPQAEQ